MLAELLLAVTVMRAGCPPVDIPLAEQLLAAASVSELDRLAEKIAANDVALRALYRSQRLTLAPSDAEERRFFKALPKSEHDFWCIYELTAPDTPIMNAGAVSVAVDPFARAARIARKLGIGHRRVLELCLWSDGELAASAWEQAYLWLLDHDPELTVAAMRTLPDAEQRRLCRGRTVGAMSMREAAQQCTALY